MLIIFSNASTGDLVYVFLLCVGAITGLTIAFRQVLKFGLPAVAVRPIVPFALFFSLIHFVTPAVKFLNDVYRYQAGYSESVRIFSTSLSLSLLLFAALLSSSRQFSCNPRILPATSQSQRKASRYTILGIITYIIGVVFAIQDAYIITNQIGYVRFLFDTHASDGMRSSLRIFSNLMILGAALILSTTLSRKKKSRANYITMAIVVTPIIVYATFLNSRNTFFISVLTIIVVYFGFSFDFRDYQKNGRRIKLKRSSIFKIPFLSFVLLFFYFGFISMSNQRYSISDSDYAAERRERLLVYSIDGAFGNDENLLWLLANNDHELLYGSTYIAGFLVVIPRRIWPEKPNGAGPYLINLIRPGSYIEGAYGNNSLTTGLMTESLINFGFFGMFVSVVIWAFLSSRFIRAFHGSVNVFYKTGFLMCAMLVSTTLLYQEFLGFFGRSFIVVAPLFIIGFLVGSSKSKVYNNKVAE